MEDQKKYDIDEGYRQFSITFQQQLVIRKLVWNKIPYPDVDFAEDQIWVKKISKKAYADTVVFHSHDYGFIEGLQRSFDESFAFHNLFNYTLVKSLKRGI